MDIREEMLETVPASLSSYPETKPAVFQKLEVQTSVSVAQAGVVIRLNGATVEINEGTSQQTIQTVLMALQGIC